MTAGAALMVTLAMVAGWGDRPALIVPGGDPGRGLLVNVTPGARPFDGPDPSRGTVVFIHGFNPFPRALHFRMAELLAQSLARRGGPPLNVLAWDWNAATWTSFQTSGNIAAAIEQGRALAAALKTTGVDPARTQVIGHSAGGIVATSAARSLALDYGQPVAQLTLLDPAAYYHTTVFDQLAAGSLAPIVENYWGTGPSGYGRAVANAGVRNTQLAGPLPYVGVVWPTRSTHLFVFHWYLDSAGDPSYPAGFGTSVLLQPAVSTVAARRTDLSSNRLPAAARPLSRESAKVPAHPPAPASVLLK